MSSTFSAKVEHFDRDKGWYYVPVPPELCKPFEHLAERGLIAITAEVGGYRWKTSLLPMGDDTHFLALPAKARKAAKLTVGANVQVSFVIRTR